MNIEYALGGQTIMDQVNDILATDLPDVDKLAQAFDAITARYVEHAQHEIELARALQDPESVVKEQIKLGVMEHARTILDDCYRLVTGRRD
jgi:hypothetical protein